MRGGGRTRFAALAAVALVVGVVLGVGADGVRPAGAAGSRAVVNIGGANHVISFGSTVTGLQALQMVASVTTLEFGGSKGAAVCSINGQGNPATQDECLVGPNGEYWSYWRAPPGASGLQYSSQGAGGTTVTDGAVEGWRYGTGGPPPFSSFCAVAGCAPPPTAPPATAAPSVAGSSATAPGTAGDGPSSTSTTRPSGTRASTTEGTDAGGTSKDEPRDGTRGDGAGQAAGRSAASGGGGGSSPVGVIAVVGILAALGGAGLVLRRRRNEAITPG